MNDTVPTPDQARRHRVIRIVQSLGLMTGGAALVLAWSRVPVLGWQLAVPAAGGVLAIVAAVTVTIRARLAYWLFLAAGFMALLDLADGYVHALFFLGSFMVLGALAAINEPDDEEALTIRRLMEEE